MPEKTKKDSESQFNAAIKAREEYLSTYLKNKNKKQTLRYFFTVFAKRTSEMVGSPWSFLISCLFIIVWAMFGPYFKYSDTWQLFVNTITTVITFLIVFLIQNTQNRDTEIINLKINELIKANSAATNSLIDLSKLSDIDLKHLEKEYTKLCNKKTGK